MKSEPAKCRNMYNSMAHPVEPHSKCGNVLSPAWSRPIERADIYCDTISWQFFEMGSGDSFAKNCPKHPKKVARWVAENEEADGSDENNDGPPPETQKEVQDEEDDIDEDL